jgi:hypothetical protein
MDTFLIPVFIGVSILLIVLLPSLLLFAIPIRCAISYVQAGECRENVITISWARTGIRISRAEGMSTMRIFVGTHSVYSRTDADEQSRKTEAPFTKAGVSRDDIARHILPAVRPIGKFGIAVFRQIRIGEVSGNLRIGLGDPVATGMLYGGYWASRFAMNASRIFVDMEPVFNDRVVECDLTMHLKLRHPLIILIETVPLVRNPDIRRLMMSFRPTPPGEAKA